MLEIALSIVANALVAGVIVFVLAPLRHRRAFQRHELSVEARFALLPALVGGALVALSCALLQGPSTLARPAMVAGAWLFAACVLGGLTGGAAQVLAAWLEPPASGGEESPPRENTSSSMLVAQLTVTLGLTLVIAVVSAAAGALRNPELAARGVPPAAAAFCVGVSLSATAARRQAICAWITETAVESAAGVVVAAAAWEANAAIFRRGPVVASALGLMMLPLVLRPLFGLATAASDLLIRVGEGENASRVHALSRGAHVTAVLTVLALAGTTLGALGQAWLPFFFCGASGVLAALAAFHAASRARSGGASSAVLLAACGSAALVSSLVAGRSGIAHAQPLALVLCAAGAQGAALFGRVTREAADTPPFAPAPLASNAAKALGALAISAAVLDAVDSAVCAKWGESVRAPLADWAGVLSHCEQARAGLGAIDIGRPIVTLSALVGVCLATFGSHGSGKSTAAISAAVVLVCLVGRAFDSAAVCLAACALAAAMASALAPARITPHAALHVAALGLALAPLAA